MKENGISRATLGRLPEYLSFLKSSNEKNVSATAVAKGLNLGEVQVRKDLSAVCGMGRPKTGYVKEELIKSIENLLEGDAGAIIIGAGKLGRALLDYSGFNDYGINMLAAFDLNGQETQKSKPILPMSELDAFLGKNDVKIGVIAVPKSAAQEVCDRLVKGGVLLIWCFAPCKLKVADNVTVQYENLALSLAHLKMH